MQTDSCQYVLSSCSYDYPGNSCLVDLNATFTPGKFYGLVGPNGSGKTTLLNILSGILQPISGSAALGDLQVCSYAKSSLAKILAIVPQQFRMEFEYTVREVVMMGRHPYIPRFGNPAGRDFKVVETALERLDILHLGNRYITKLSGGERQRVLVARALAQETPVMLLDEATASLDIRHSIDIMRVMKERVVCDNALIIAAIHDLDLAAAFCDELIVLKDGVIHAQGSVESVLTNELLQAVFAVETKIFSTPWQTTHIQYRYTNEHV